MRMLIVLVGLLVGCATGSPPVVMNEAKEVLVPVAQPCNVVMPKPPKWEVETVVAVDMFSRMDTALKEIEQRTLYELELEELLNYCIGTDVVVPLSE